MPSSEHTPRQNYGTNEGVVLPHFVAWRRRCGWSHTGIVPRGKNGPPRSVKSLRGEKEKELTPPEPGKPTFQASSVVISDRD